MRLTVPGRRVPSLPLFLIHGDIDDYVLPYNSERLLEARPGGTERWVVPGAHRVQSDQVAGAEYRRRVHDFFDRNL